MGQGTHYGNVGIVPRVGGKCSYYLRVQEMFPGEGVMVRVLFLCTGNSARSQMAEAMLREWTGDGVEVASAGTNPAGVHPLTVEILKDIGIDASQAVSEHLDRYLSQVWSFVITVCDQAAESCPVFPGAVNSLHWSFPDPASAIGDVKERRATFELVRDAIHERVETFIGETFEDSGATEL